jgi:adenosylcobinamide-GDP ribazoletransferase
MTMKRFLLALQFLTIIPVGKAGYPEPGELGRSMAFFPLVGALQGVILVAADYLLLKVFPVSVASGLLLIILFLTNGGLHLDGFVDTVDGLIAGATPEERLRIMRDNQTGAIGVVCVVVLLLLKFLCIEALAPEARGIAVFMFPVAGRWAMTPMASWAGYARKEEGLGKAFTGVDNITLFTATAITALFLVLLFGLWGLFPLGFLALLTYVITGFFNKRLGGVTGDVFGFHSEVAEVFFLILVVASF